MKRATRMSVLVLWLACCVGGLSTVRAEAPAKGEDKAKQAKAEKKTKQAAPAEADKAKGKTPQAKPAKKSAQPKAAPDKASPSKPPAKKADKKAPATTTSTKPAKKSPFKKQAYEDAYAMAMIIAHRMKAQGFKPHIDTFTQAMKDVWNDKETELSRKEARELSLEWAKTVAARQKIKKGGKPKNPPKEFSDEAFRKLNYASGLQLAAMMKSKRVTLDMPHFVQGMKDTLAGKPKLDLDRATEAVKRVQAQMMKPQRPEYAEGLAEKNAKAAEAFLKANKKKEGVITTPTGLQYKVLKPGEGESPEINDKAIMHFKGWKLDGKTVICDSREGKGEPVTAPLRAVIPGLTEALQQMTIGGKMKVWIPPHLGYTEVGAGEGSEVGPNEALIFELELFDIEKSDIPPFKPRDDL